jgi:hypothetical protein
MVILTFGISTDRDKMKKILTLLLIGIVISVNPIGIACTVFHASNDNMAFGGNN